MPRRRLIRNGPHQRIPAARWSGNPPPRASSSATRFTGRSTVPVTLRSGRSTSPSRGWSQTVQFRMKPAENSSLELHYFGVLDRGAPVTGQDQGGEEARLIGETSRDHWRAAASIDYLSSFLFRQAFSETYSQAVNSEVRSVAYLSHNLAGLSLNASAERYQNFYQDPLTNSYSNQIKILHLPMVELNGTGAARRFLAVRVGVDTSGAGLQRSEPGFVTADLVGRLDIRPRIALPLHWKGWELRPEIAVHDTLYTQQCLGVGHQPAGRGQRHGAQPARPGSLDRAASSGAGEGFRSRNFWPPPQARHRAHLHLSLHDRRGQLPEHYPLRSDRHSQQHQRIRVRRHPAHLRAPPLHPSRGRLRGGPIRTPQAREPKSFRLPTSPE